MEQLMIFYNDEFGQIRTVVINNEPFFVGNDVACALGYAEPRSTISKKVEDEDRGVAKIETPSGIQEMTVINESGIYSLVFGSKLESAKKFKRWVTSEVLPSIRETGSYNSKPKCIEDVLIESLQEMKAMRERFENQDKKIESVTSQVEGIREVVSLDTTSWRTDTQSLINKIALSLGGGQAYSSTREESYKLLNSRMGVDVSTRLTNMRRRMAEEGTSKSKRDKMSYLDVIANDKKLIEGYVAIVKEMAIKYGVA